LVLIDTPLAPYFSEHLTSEDLDEMNVEVLRNTLYKAYLDDFAAFASRLGGTTAAVVGQMLAFQADRRALNISLNSIGTELTRDDRRRLYPSCGLLFPHGLVDLAAAEDVDQVRAAVERCPAYATLFGRGGSAGGEGQSLDKVLFEEEVRLAVQCFEQQFHFGVFLAYMTLREQEVRNVMWVSECVAQDQRSRIMDGVVFSF
jgi:V-type H+-transporting ATPase subunit d